MWEDSVFHELQKKTEHAHAGGGKALIKKQHEKGKLTARERLEILFDKGTFTEVGALVESRIDDFGADKKRVPGDGVITGFGMIDGRLAFASSEDFTVFGGTLGECHSSKICEIMDMALRMRAPIITINDSGGARIEEGVNSLAGYSSMFLKNTRASGIIPQIAVIMGPCAGGACYSPAICDFVFIVEKTGMMFITGPKVVEAVTHEKVTSEQLGGAEMHMTKSGVAHFSFSNDVDCLLNVRKLLSYLPQNNTAPLPVVPGQPIDLCKGLQEVVPQDQRLCYNVRTVIGAMVDKHSFFEVQPKFAMNAVVGFGRMDGETVGFVANQPQYMGGTIDYNASDKIARFVRFCDCFNIPIVTLVDVPAFLPGMQQEQNGIIRHGAKILYAYSEAVVPKISLIMRKAYGGAYISMNSKEMGADIVYAWPIAEIAVMGGDGAADIIFKNQIRLAENPTLERERLINDYNRRFLNPYIAAARGFVDEVIRPEDTRKKIKGALVMLKTKTSSLPQKKHGNIPL